jgi:archaemetzincin
MSSLLIVPIGSNHTLLLPALAARLESIFDLDVTVASTGLIDPSTAFSVTRNQYSSTLLLSSLAQVFPQHTGKLLGITSFDLYVPVLKYVFGEAQLDGCCAVVSFHRFDEPFYGFPANPRLLQERISKEATHVLGHSYGLLHCEDHKCAMYSSTAVAEVDMRAAAFCAACNQTLKQRIDGKDSSRRKTT